MLVSDLTSVVMCRKSNKKIRYNTLAEEAQGKLGK
jgi:hypothetical protein